MFYILWLQKKKEKKKKWDSCWNVGVPLSFNCALNQRQTCYCGSAKWLTGDAIWDGRSELNSSTAGGTKPPPVGRKKSAQDQIWTIGPERKCLFPFTITNIHEMTIPRSFSSACCPFISWPLLPFSPGFSIITSWYSGWSCSIVLIHCLLRAHMQGWGMNEEYYRLQFSMSIYWPMICFYLCFVFGQLHDKQVHFVRITKRLVWILTFKKYGVCQTANSQL